MVKKKRVAPTYEAYMPYAEGVADYACKGRYKLLWDPELFQYVAFCY